jgi:hypothetical protein
MTILIYQEAFQGHLNAMAPIAGNHGDAPVMPQEQNAFGILGQMAVNLDNESTNTVTTEVAAFTYQSQLTASTVVNSIQLAEQQFAHLALQQNLMHENMHQIIAQNNVLSFNQSNAGKEKLEGYESGSGRHLHSRRKQGSTQTAFNSGQFGGGFAPVTSGSAPGPTAAVEPYGSMTQGSAPPSFYAPASNHQGSQMQYHPPKGGYGAGGYGNTPPGGRPPAAPFSNRAKQGANWNACYSYGFHVPDGHTSMTWPTNL